MSLKKAIVEELEKNRGINISGEALASKLAVSRAAVWKAVDALRKEGYAIEAVPNKGYRFSENADVLSVEGMRLFLAPEYANATLFVLKNIDSTNHEGKKRALDGARHGTIIVAETQTDGKGRFQRKFFSPPKTGIYMSVILRPEFLEPGLAPSDVPLVTSAAAVSVCQAIEELSERAAASLEPRIKWVNDIFLEERKICGILTEAISDFETGIISSVVAGIGVNFSTAEFPPELRDIAGALFQCNSPSFTRNELAAKIINHFLRLCENLKSRDFLKEYKALSCVLGEEIVYLERGEPRRARAVDIDRNGHLIVRDANGGTNTLMAGEISIIPNSTWS
jgi:BirA family biotin operon repressor/biotin-[acetyl-CoA-carboxylase] ligase